MSENLKREEISGIFEKAKALSNADKMAVRRAYRLPRNWFNPIQDLMYEKIFGNAKIYPSEFAMSLIALYVKNGCNPGKKRFELCLKDIYDNSGQGIKNDIGYFLDDRDKKSFCESILRYMEMRKDAEINLPELLYDTQNWSYKIRNRWIKTIAGTYEPDSESDTEAEA